MKRVVDDNISLFIATFHNLSEKKHKKKEKRIDF